MRIRLTSEPDQRVCLESPYDPGLVQAIKDTIPWDGREWDGTRKRWLISPLYIDDFLAWCGTNALIQVIDDRAQNLMEAAQSPYASMPDDLRESFAQLYLGPSAPLLVAEASYKALSRYFHPDMSTGNHDTMEELNNAILTIRRYLAPGEQA